MPTAIATPLNAGLNRVATQPVMKPVVAAMDNAIAIVADAVDVVAVTDKAIVANAPSAMSAANGTQKVQHARRKTPLLRVKPVSHANRVNRVNRDRIVAPVAKVSAKVVRVRVSAMADVMVDAMVVAKAGMTLHAIRKTHVPIKPMPRQHRLRAATKRRRRTVLAGNAAKAAVNDVSVVSAGTVVNVAANAANVAAMRQKGEQDRNMIAGQGLDLDSKRFALAQQKQQAGIQDAQRLALTSSGLAATNTSTKAG